MSAKGNPDPILSGIGSSQGSYTGPVIVINGAEELSRVKPGDVLVCRLTTPDYTSVFEKIGAIVTDMGGITSHAAIVARELGKPAVVGTKTATADLKTGQIVTVVGSEGKVYLGQPDAHSDEDKMVSVEKIEDYFIPTGNDIDDFISFTLISMPQQTEVWPLPASHIMPFIDMDQALDMLLKLRQLDAEGVGDEEIANLLENPVKVRAFLLGIGIIGIKTAQHIRPDKVSLDDQIYLTNKLLGIAKILCNNDSKYLYGQTLFLGPERANEAIESTYELSANDPALASLFSVTTFMLNWSFAWDFFAYGNNFLHGPYDAEAKFGPLAKLFIREVDFSELDEVWPLIKDIGYKKISFYQVYKSDNLWANVGSRIRGEGDLEHMLKAVVLLDGQPATDEKLRELNTYFKTLTSKQVNHVNGLERREVIIKGAENSYAAHKKFYLHFGEKWFPRETVKKTIDQLSSKIFGKEAGSATRSEDTKRKMWDPRNDYLDFM